MEKKNTFNEYQFPVPTIETAGTTPDPVAGKCALEIESIAFESKQPDRGYTVKASYLTHPKSDALVEIFKDGLPLRAFLFPAYKVWNIAAHFGDIVDGEIAGNASGYEMAAWDGISNALFYVPKRETETTLAVRHCANAYDACCLPWGWCHCNCGDCRVAKYTSLATKEETK